MTYVVTLIYLVIMKIELKVLYLIEKMRMEEQLQETETNRLELIHILILKQNGYISPQTIPLIVFFLIKLIK